MAAWHRSPLFAMQNTKRRSLATSVLESSSATSVLESSSATSATAALSEDPTTSPPSLWQRWTRAAQQPHFWVYALVLPRIVEKTRLILQMAVFLWAFTLYDVVGRASGAVEAIWVLVLVALLPSWVAVLQWVVQQTGSRMSLRGCSSRATEVLTSAERVDGGEVEMQTQMQNPLHPIVLRANLQSSTDNAEA
eukprot:gene4848-3477_t